MPNLRKADNRCSHQKPDPINLSAQIAKHIREVHFGGNWTSVNLKDVLANVTWQQATTKRYAFNTIASLVYHINYYVSAVLKVLQGAALDSHDKFSFEHPPILSQLDWETLLTKTFADAETFATLIEQYAGRNAYRNVYG